MSHVITSTLTVDREAARRAGSAVVDIDLRDDLASMRGIATSMALSAPLWAAIAAFIWWVRHQPG